MAAHSGDGNQQQQPAVNGSEDFPEEQLPPIVGGGDQEQQNAPPALPGEATPERPSAPRRLHPRHGRRPPANVALLSVRALRLWRHVAHTLLEWFAARPLGQRALEAVGYTIATAEQATIWAGAATQHRADCPPLPFSWYYMMPVVMALMVVRTGAALAERYLNVQLPQNKELVNWLEGQRTHLERLQTKAAVHISTKYVDENDTVHSFLNRWPFNIPYRAAQQLGLIPVRVNEQPSDTSTDSTSVPTLEPVTSTSSGSSTLTEDEHTEPVSREQTPPPEAALDHTLYFSPAAEGQPKEESDKEEEEQQQEQDDKQEEVEGETAKEQTERPAITEEEDVEMALEAASPEPEPQPAPPEHKPLEEQERAAMAVPPPAPQPTSEDLLAAERASTSAPATTTTTTSSSSRGRKAAARGSKTSFLVNLFALKLA